MTKSRLLLPLLAIGTLVGATPASATSDLWYRYPATAAIGPCSGKIVERVLEGGSVTYGYANVVAACMTSLTQADWVMVASVECGDPVRYKPGLCEGKNPTSPAIAGIRKIAEYAENNRGGIRLARATIGRGCALVPSERDAHWSCEARKAVMNLDHSVAATPFRDAQGNFDIPLFGKTLDLPTAIDQKLAGKAVMPQPPVGPARAAAPVSEPEYPHWIDNGKQIAYGPPETDAEAALNCVAPGKIDLWVFDPMKGARPFRSWIGSIESLGRTERTHFRVHSGGDGDSLIFSVSTDGLALASLLQNQDFKIQIPTGEIVIVPGREARKIAANFKTACDSGKALDASVALQAVSASSLVLNDRAKHPMARWDKGGFGGFLAFETPKSEVVLTLTCSRPAVIELTAKATTRLVKGLKSASGLIEALGRTETVTFEVQPSENQLTFTLGLSSIALESLIQGQDVTIRIPTGETVIVPAQNGASSVAELRGNCQPSRPSRASSTEEIRSILAR